MFRFIPFLFFILFLSCDQQPIGIIKTEKAYKVSDNQLSEMKDYVERHSNFTQSKAFLVDFSLPSRKNRFFVVDLEKDSIILNGLVTHGSCTGSTAPENAQYSNIENSYCSSLGKYRIGNSYQGTFGLAYKLHGLESSNKNAYSRFIVLHAHECVPDEEVNYPIYLSQGCPTVSPSFLSKLAVLIDESEKDILLMIEE